MNIQSLTLHNFRNFLETEIDFSPQGLLVAAAPNATGKTNFLESIVMLLRGRSFRASTQECVGWGKDGFGIKGRIERNEGETTVTVTYQSATKRLKIEENNLPASPVTFYSHYPLVLFLPEDTFMFTRGPAQRRNFLNRVLVSSGVYIAALVQYQRVLRQRNATLKNAQSFTDVEAWTELLVQHGEILWQHRQSFVEFITTHLAELYEAITGETRDFTAELLREPKKAGDRMEQFRHVFAEERRYGYTLYGPHRDDVYITSHGRSLPATLSQGQLRSVVIALKLAAQSFIYQVTEEQPIVLLDEVLSELDENHQRALLSHLPAAQTILTCTSLPSILQHDTRVQVLDLRTIMARRVPAVASTHVSPTAAAL